MTILVPSAPTPVSPCPSMRSLPPRDASGRIVTSNRKHSSSNTSSFLDRQNAHRKRQRRQAAGALVTGFFGGGNSTAGPAPVPSAEERVAVPESQVLSPAKTEKKPTKKKSTAQPRPAIQIPARGIGPIYDPNNNDVLCGRGGRINAHTGNVRFRDIVVQRKKDYLSPTTKKLEKAHIAADIVRDIREKDPPGRFLKEDPDGSWYDIGDAKAIKKVGQALREDGPDIREEIGSDEEKESAESAANKGTSSPNAEKSKKQGSPTHVSSATVQPLATVNIGAATAVSGRGAKVITTQPGSQRSVASQQSKGSYKPLAYQEISASPASYQPILPPDADQAPKTIFPGMRRRGPKGVSGAAAVAMGLTDDRRPDNFSAPPTPDIAFGRQFHVPDAGGESSMLSGMSANTGANPSALSGTSGVSALTDPISGLSGGDNMAPRAEFPQPLARPQTAHQFQSMRYNQLQQLRQQWAQGSQRTMESCDMRSISSASLQRSRSWQERMLHGDNMSWADHSLIGGGIADVNSIMSGQQSFHSYYLRDQHPGAAFQGGPSSAVISGTSSAYGISATSSAYGTSMMRAGSSGMVASAAVVSNFQVHTGYSLGQQPQQPALQQEQVPAPIPSKPHPGQMYYTSSSGDDSSGKTHRIAGGGGGNASVTSMSLASASLSGSIMSDLSENLIALDLAEPRLLDQLDP